MTFRTMLLNLAGIIAVILPAGFFSADIFKPEFEEYDFGYLSMIVAAEMIFGLSDMKTPRKTIISILCGFPIMMTRSGTLYLPGK